MKVWLHENFPLVVLGMLVVIVFIAMLFVGVNWPAFVVAAIAGVCAGVMGGSR